jgi:hypothetical protein
LRNLAINRQQPMAPLPVPIANPTRTKTGIVPRRWSSQYPASVPARTVNSRTKPISEKRAM